MSKQDGLAWGKKAYLCLSLAVVAVIWICFFGSLLFGRLSHGPVEETWFLEVMKWVVMTPVLVGIVDGVAYAWIATVASRKGDGIDTSLWQEIKDLFKKKEKVEEVPVVEVEEEQAPPVVEEPAPASKRTRKKKVVEE